MGPPDMRLPIQYAMAYPERVASSAIPTYDPLSHPSLTFEPLDIERNPCFAIALEAGRKGGTYPAVLSAADEEAVRLFLDGRIRFGDIPPLVRDVLADHDGEAEVTIESLLGADEWARRRVAEVVAAVR